jgi:hypothetical protein
VSLTSPEVPVPMLSTIATGPDRTQVKLAALGSDKKSFYILAYYMEHDEENKIDEEGLHEMNIEGVKKEFKTHRSAIDFDEKFIHIVSEVGRIQREPEADNNSNSRINYCITQTKPLTLKKNTPISSACYY